MPLLAPGAHAVFSALRRRRGGFGRPLRAAPGGSRAVQAAAAAGLFFFFFQATGPAIGAFQSCPAEKA